MAESGVLLSAFTLMLLLLPWLRSLLPLLLCTFARGRGSPEAERARTRGENDVDGDGGGKWCASAAAAPEAGESWAMLGINREWDTLDSAAISDVFKDRRNGGHERRIGLAYIFDRHNAFF